MRRFSACVLSLVLVLCAAFVAVPVSAEVLSPGQTYTFDFSEGGMAQTIVNKSNYTDSKGNVFYPLHSESENTSVSLKQIEVTEKDDTVKIYDSLEYIPADDTIFIPVDSNGKPYEVNPNTTYSVKIRFFAKTVGAWQQFFAGAGAYEPYKESFSSTSKKFGGRTPTSNIYYTGSYAYGGTWTGSYFSSETDTNKVRMFDNFDKDYGAHYYENTATFTTGDFTLTDKGFTLTADGSTTVATFGNYFCITGSGSLVNAYIDNGDGTRTLYDSRYTQFNFIEISITELKPTVIEDINGVGLSDSSGFIAGDMLTSIDFTGMEKGSIPADTGWETLHGSIVGSPNGNGNALNLNWNWGETYLRTKMDVDDYVVVAKLGCEENNPTADGWTSISIRDTDANGEIANAMRFGYGQKNRSATSTPKPGTLMYANGFYVNAGNMTFDGDGYTETILTMYCFDNVFYFYLNGEYIGTDINCTGVTVEGENYIYICDAWVESSYVHWVAAYEIIPVDFDVIGSRFSLNEDGAAIDVKFAYDNSKLGNFDISDASFGAIVTRQNGSTPTNTTIETQDKELITIEPENSSKLEFEKDIALTKADADKYINIRPFILLDGEYYYCTAVAVAPANLAVNLYNNSSDDEKKLIDAFFENSVYYKGGNSKRITFTALSDFHYFPSRPTYSNLEDLVTVLERAEESNSSLVIQAGDFCQEITKSPELYDTFHNYTLENGEVLKTYGVYGNHEMESGSTVADVTPTLTNDKSAVWGTADGKMNADGTNSYYYVDTAEGFRFIFLDTNYSQNPETLEWEHNKPWSWSYPAGNINGYSLGDVQTAWLLEVLTEAGKSDIPCIITSHTSFNKEISAQASDADAVLEMFKSINDTYPGTVMACLSGHTHFSRVEYAHNILWINLHNTFASFDTGDSIVKNTEHYTEEHIRSKEMYDDNGNFIGYEDVLMDEKWAQYYFTQEPLSSTITIDESGIIVIDGFESSWACGVEPDEASVNGLDITHRDYLTDYMHDYASFDCEFNGHFDGNNDGNCDVCGHTSEALAAGDVNGDGNVNAADLATLKKVIAGLIPLDSEEVKYPDVDGNGGTPNAADLAKLKKILAGIDDIDYEDPDVWTDPVGAQ